MKRAGRGKRNNGDWHPDIQGSLSNGLMIEDPGEIFFASAWGGGTGTGEESLGQNAITSAADSP
ncbi:hypothetical protein D3C76_1591170 [compost metagenome]